MSIDNYLDAHMEDERTVIAGKLAIAQSILEAERSSKLYFERNRSGRGIDFRNVEDTWFNKFVQLVTENCRRDALSQSLENVSVISFNYDRCLEHFLFHAIQNYYRLGSEEATEALSHIDIFHPYGRVGSLPWQREETPIDFGAEPHTDRLLDISKQLRTFAEGTDPETSNIEGIRKRVWGCDRLIFLGFAYHPMNMQVLASEQEDVAPSASYGTALGLSGPDCEILKQEIHMLVGHEIKRVHLRNDLTCSKIFDEYRRSLTSS
jgi:hypothetical protein